MTKQHFLISAPGRTEISGNHTDHQRGCVLAAAVNLETVADVTLNDSNNICVRSEGYPETVVELDDLNIRDEEKNTTAASTSTAAIFNVLFSQPLSFQSLTVRYSPASSASCSHFSISSSSCSSIASFSAYSAPYFS